MATYTPKTRPYQHQIDALRKSAGRDSFAYFMEMGTGKSKTIIDDAGRAFVSGRISRLLIFANKGSYANWVNYEIPAHMPDDIQRAVYIWTGKDGQWEREKRSQVLRRDLTGVFQVLVMNIEGMGASDRARDLAMEFVTGGPAMVVVDESTTIKNHEAVRTKYMALLGREAVMRRIATGSPITKDPLDLWGQFMFLGGDLLGHRSYWSFRARYAVLEQKRIGRRTIQVPVAFRYLNELEETVGRHSHRVLKEDCLDLPAKIYSFREVEMTPEQVRLYEQMRRVAVAQIDDGQMTATIAMTQIMRMQQILCGWVTDDDTKRVSDIPSNRARIMLETIEESPEASVIIWCAYRRDVGIVVRELTNMYGPESVVQYHGGTGDVDRAEAVRRFQEGSARFFVGTPPTAGRGITLTRGTLAIYYSNDYNLEYRLQSEDRCHRIGQREHVNYVDLVTRGSVDERIVNALRKKIDVASLVMGDGARSWLV